MNIFSPQLVSNRDSVKFKQNMNHGEFGLAAGEVPFKKPNNGTLTYNLNPSSVLPPSSKRPRESHFRDSNVQFASPVKRRSVAFSSSSSPSSMIDVGFITQIQNQQQSEIDRFVAHQTEKLKTEIEARQQTQTRMLASAVQNAIAKKLKEKDEEIVRIRNLNWVLHERVKSLYVENQIWREIAQNNEANAINLRTNLDNVLAQVEKFRNVSHAGDNDLESSCGSCGPCGDNDGEAVRAVSGVCKRCGVREARVLVLPCRHLCLCTVCCSASVRTCPVCDSVTNASVHVNMS